MDFLLANTKLNFSCYSEGVRKNRVVKVPLRGTISPELSVEEF